MISALRITFRSVIQHLLANVFPVCRPDLVSRRRLYRAAGRGAGLLADLARRLQNRRLFEYVDYSEENLAQIKNMLKEQNLDEKYYLRVENVEASVYSPYKGRKILIEQLDGKIVALEKASTIVESITKGETKREGTIFYPR